MHFHLLTIFPQILDSYLNESILNRAQKNNIITISKYNLRDWTIDKHKTVDDTPYGGGAGMVMKVDILAKAVDSITTGMNNKKTKVVLLSAKGKTWNQQLAKKFSKLDNVVFICGRYEGVDERIKKVIDEEISIGDFVLTGGELGAAIMIDSITRLLPGALGNAQSAVQESHSMPGMLEYPQYTRPEIFEYKSKKQRVPKVLLSGNHAEIDKWRQAKSKQK
ncbi:MAG: tRNA (guanosine(37)-N1)-methyltransferase TrmD [Candidatus Falkowbacteria bacterium]